MSWESSDAAENHPPKHCKGIGNKNSQWSSPCFHSHTEAIKLLNTQSSRKSARIKKMQFPNVRNKHTVPYRAKTHSHRVTSPYLFHLARSACFSWKTFFFFYFFAELFSFASSKLRNTLSLVSVFICVTLLSSPNPGWTVWWWVLQKSEGKQQWLLQTDENVLVWLNLSSSYTRTNYTVFKAKAFPPTVK